MKRSTDTQGAENSPRRYNLPTFICPNLLMVEGPDEFQFFRFIRPREDVQIHVYEGKNQLQLELETIRGIEGFDKLERIAIVRDADQNAKAALQSVLNQWASAFGKTKPKVQSDEWFTDEQERQWSVWLMPEPDKQGDLEELLWQAVTVNDHSACIDSLIECLDACEPIPFGSKTKARLYAWLSTQKDPIKELHAAFKRKRSLFDRNSPAFARFCALIDNM